MGVARSFSFLAQSKRNQECFIFVVFLRKSAKYYSCKDAWWVVLSLIWVQDILNMPGQMAVEANG